MRRCIAIRMHRRRSMDGSELLLAPFHRTYGASDLWDGRPQDTDRTCCPAPLLSRVCATSSQDSQFVQFSSWLARRRAHREFLSRDAVLATATMLPVTRHACLAAFACATAPSAGGRLLHSRAHTHSYTRESASEKARIRLREGGDTHV